MLKGQRPRSSNKFWLQGGEGAAESPDWESGMEYPTIGKNDIFGDGVLD
jgi:hypothetical protein